MRWPPAFSTASDATNTTCWVHLCSWCRKYASFDRPPTPVFRDIYHPECVEAYEARRLANRLDLIVNGD